MVTCYHDSHGFARAEVRGHPAVSAYLEQDIQASPETCREVLHAIEEVESGKVNEWEGTGNAFTMSVRPDGVTIENVWDESMGVETLSISDFKTILNEWLKFVSA
ncbi:MAG TPA: YacL family protein [Tepidisphaeraceae bacterium]|jgi:uncharacterized protein YacL (UPF0231 family)|nr:YacL family protein [Tepidisphaeraceae bacterium]